MIKHLIQTWMIFNVFHEMVFNLFTNNFSTDLQFPLFIQKNNKKPPWNDVEEKFSVDDKKKCCGIFNAREGQTINWNEYEKIK